MSALNEEEAAPVLPGQDGGDDAPPVELEESTLEPLVAQCQAGVMASCDLLGAVATPGSEAATIAGNCGGRLEGKQDDEPGRCSREFPPEQIGPGEDEKPAPMPDVADVRQACAEGDMAACDQLWIVGVGEDEQFGATCGGRREPSTDSCVDTIRP
ncbi:MAG: hypothetical protein Q4P33_06840 [Flaviflexus sp.]|nr:hypothetical protein [Flaviflexus sp.]